MPELRHAGVLPALNTPAHLVGTEAKVGEVREALATRTGVEMGTSKPARALRPLPEGERVTVRVAGDLGKDLVVVRHEDPAHHPGHAVRRADSLAKALEGYDTRIAASRQGEPVGKLPAYRLRGRVALAFGPPSLSVEEVAQREGAQVKWDFALNAVPGQGTETVRTEEAVLLCMVALHARALERTQPS
jgi:hypothetical protein